MQNVTKELFEIYEQPLVRNQKKLIKKKGSLSFKTFSHLHGDTQWLVFIM